MAGALQPKLQPGMIARKRFHGQRPQWSQKPCLANGKWGLLTQFIALCKVSGAMYVA
jgi:hypothetical protein